MELGKLLTEGKGKRVYATDDPDQAIVYFKDEAMAFHGLKRGRILGKGEVNNAISEQFFKMLEENGIPTHYLRRLDARQSLVKRCQILPVSVKVRNRVAGSLAKRIGLPTGTKLDTTVIELELKGSEMDYPLINITHVEALHLATREEMNYVIETARKINQILSDFTSEIGVELVDFKLEFGRYTVNCSLRMKSALILRASGMPGRMSRWTSTASAVIWAALNRRIRICCTG